MRVRSLCICTTALFFAISGCERHTSTLPGRLLGTWRVDVERSEPTFLEGPRDMKAHHPAIDVDRMRASWLSMVQATRLVISEAQFEHCTGNEVVDKARYEVVECGEDYVVIRFYPEKERFFNDKTFQELVDEAKANSKTVNMCSVYEFLDADHFRRSGVKVENGKVTPIRPNASTEVALCNSVAGLSRLRIRPLPVWPRPGKAHTSGSFFVTSTRICSRRYWRRCEIPPSSKNSPSACGKSKDYSPKPSSGTTYRELSIADEPKCRFKLT